MEVSVPIPFWRLVGDGLELAAAHHGETSVHIPLRLLITVLAVVFVIKVIARVGRHSREVVSDPMRIRRHVERCRDRFSSVRERFSNVRRRRALSVGFAMLLAAAFSATLLAAACATLFWWGAAAPHQRWVYIDASDSWMRTTTDAPRESADGKDGSNAAAPPSIAAPPKPAAPPAASVPPPAHVLQMAKPKRSTAFAAVTGALAETFRKAGRAARLSAKRHWLRHGRKCRGRPTRSTK